MEMNRTIEQWRGCDPEAMAYHMSEAATMYAFKDAKADILALHAENERLRAQAQHESDCAEAYKTEADRLRDENANLTYENDKLWAELRVCAAALPGPIYMDPPDGGSVTVAEQVARMAKDAARYRWLRTEASAADWEMFGYQDIDKTDAAIDAAMQKVE